MLIPMTGTGNQAVIPAFASYSTDGAYLIYATTPCADLSHVRVHLRNLRTGRTVARQGYLDSPAVFVDHDTRAAFVDVHVLAVLQLPSVRLRKYAAPAGCRYQALAGTGTALVAMLQCGARDALSVVAVSPRTFVITRTIVRLGGCQGGESISLALHDPSAMLAETYRACLSPMQFPTRYEILTIWRGKSSLVTSGSSRKMPLSPVW